MTSATVAIRFFILFKLNENINCVAPILGGMDAGFSCSGIVRYKLFLPSYQHSLKPLALLCPHHFFSPSPLGWGRSRLSRTSLPLKHTLPQGLCTWSMWSTLSRTNPGLQQAALQFTSTLKCPLPTPIPAP